MGLFVVLAVSFFVLDLLYVEEFMQCYYSSICLHQLANIILASKY